LAKLASYSLLLLAMTLVAGIQPASASPAPIGFNLGSLTSAGGGVFDFSGALANSTSVSGTITINTTTGMVTAADLSYGGQTYSDIVLQGVFTGFTNSGQTPLDVGYDLWVGINSSFPQFRLIIPGTESVGSLVGYSGGTLCSFSQACGPDEQGNYWASDYHPAAATPEPGTLSLLGTALLALGFFTKRR
jgi:hypothetical protein